MPRLRMTGPRWCFTPGGKGFPDGFIEAGLDLGPCLADVERVYRHRRRAWGRPCLLTARTGDRPGVLHPPGGEAQGEGS